MRWDAVVEIQDQRRLLQNEIDTLRALKGHPAKKLLEQRIKSLDWAGSKKEVSLEVAYDRASTLLANTPASDKEDAMKRSYNTVQENMRTPATAMRYHILDPEFLSRFRAPTK